MYSADIINGVDKPQFFEEHNDASWQAYIRNGPEKDEVWSDFLHTVSDASVEVSDLDSVSWNWPSLADEEDKIRVFPVDINAGLDAMGDGIHLVKLPHKIPIGGEASNGLFIRNEDIGLMKAWSVFSTRNESILLRSVVLGHPGISKSWHLWKYVVMAANTDVWKAVTSAPTPKEEEQELVSGQASVAGAGPEDEEEETSPIRDDERLDPKDVAGIEQDLEEGADEFPFRPRVIVFVNGGPSEPKTRVLFLDDKVVHKFKNMDVVSVLNHVADSGTGNVRMLYEPAGSAAMVPHEKDEHNNIPCTAALSPLRDRYKEFLKEPSITYPFIMQCPSENEHEAIIRFFVWLTGGSQDVLEARLQELRARLPVVGPFLRLLLATTEDFDQYVKDSQQAIKGMPREELNRLLRTIETKDATHVKTTHRVARYVTPNAIEGDFKNHYLVPSNVFVLNRVRDQLDQLEIDKLRSMVMRYETNLDEDTDNPKALESLTKRYILSSDGLLWQYAICSLSFDRGALTDKNAVKEESMKRFSVGCKKYSLSSCRTPKARDMDINTLYRPEDPNYPFVDMLWIEDQVDANKYDDIVGDLPPVFSSRCSVSAQHPKELSVYNSLRESLGMPTRQLLIVYMTTIPRAVNGYLTGPVSAFLKGSKRKRKALWDTPSQLEVPRNVEFRVLLPDKEMNNKMAKKTDYLDDQDKVYALPDRAMSSRHELTVS